MLPVLLSHLYLFPHLNPRRGEERGRVAVANSRVRFRESEGGIPRPIPLHSVWDCSETRRRGRDGGRGGQGRVPDGREKGMEWL